MKPLPDKMKDLLALLQNTNDNEIDCDEFWEKAAMLAEQDPSLESELVKAYLHHYELCPGCAEEFDLLKKLAADGGGAG